MRLKKKRGSVVKFAIPMFTLVIIFISMIMLFTYLKDFDKKDNVSIIVREYLLKMETEGYLTSSDETSLISKLSDCGVKNISLVGTTKSEVGYGNQIVLSVNGDMEISSFDVLDIFNIKEKKTTAKIAEYRTSTAKN